MYNFYTKVSSQMIGDVIINLPHFDTHGATLNTNRGTHPYLADDVVLSTVMLILCRM